MNGTEILLIDDNVDLAENISEILQDEGATVRHAATARAGLELARDGFDVALVDIRLPDGTGLELLPKLRALGGDMPELLLITGDATLEDAIQAVQAGAYDYVVKPFEPMRLITTIERASRQVETRKQTSILAQQLAQREANLRTLVETVQVMLVTLDASGDIRTANTAAEQLLGAPQATLRGRNLGEFVPTRDQAVIKDALDRVSADELASFETRVLDTSSTPEREYRIRWQWTPLRQKQDEDLVIYASGLDVTAFSELERRTRLAEKLAAVGTLAAGLAHEVRNPLNAAELQLQLLGRRIAKLNLPDPMQAKSSKALESVHAELGRLTRLVEHFLNFARPSELHVSTVDLHELFSNFHALQRPLAEQKGVELTLSLPTTPVSVQADPEKLQQIFLNIVRNAVQSASPSGNVAVILEPDGAGARVTVKDSGDGIPEQDLLRVFEPFFTTTEGGTGLGMAITHSLVTLHGGEIDLLNDNGLKVEVRLPACPPTDGGYR